MAQRQDSSDPTGVTSPVRTSTVERARDRKQNAALQLKLAGATWDEVAQTIGYPTARAALVAVEGALERELQNPENKEAMRNLGGKRLERLLRAVWTKAIDPDSPEQLAAVGKSRELLQDFAKLYGLNAPTEIAVHNPTQAEIERWVSTVSQAATPQVREYDIIAGEIEQAYEEMTDDAIPDDTAVAEPYEDPVRDLLPDAEPDLPSVPADRDAE